MCIYTTTTFSCGHKLHKRESTEPECVLNIHDTPPVEESRDEICKGCTLRAPLSPELQDPTLQLLDEEQAPKKKKGNVLGRALNLITGKGKEEVEGKEKERKGKKGKKEPVRRVVREAEPPFDWHDFLSTNNPGARFVSRSHSDRQ